MELENTSSMIHILYGCVRKQVISKDIVCWYMIR